MSSIVTTFERTYELSLKVESSTPAILACSVSTAGYKYGRARGQIELTMANYTIERERVRLHFYIVNNYQSE